MGRFSNKPRKFGRTGNKTVSKVRKSLSWSLALFINLNLIHVFGIALGTLLINFHLIQVSSIALGSLKSFSNDDSELNEEIVTLAFENGINFFDISEPFTSQKAEVNYSRLGKELNTSLVI